jgi:hypothetical protein
LAKLTNYGWAMASRIENLMPDIEQLAIEYPCKCNTPLLFWVFQHHPECTYRKEMESHLEAIAEVVGLECDTLDNTKKAVLFMWAAKKQVSKRIKKHGQDSGV